MSTEILEMTKRWPRALIISSTSSRTKIPHAPRRHRGPATEGRMGQLERARHELRYHPAGERSYSHLAATRGHPVDPAKCRMRRFQGRSQTETQARPLPHGIRSQGPGARGFLLWPARDQAAPRLFRLCSAQFGNSGTQLNVHSVVVFKAITKADALPEMIYRH